MFALMMQTKIPYTKIQRGGDGASDCGGVDAMDI
jgi:hypothetical protein